MNKSFKVIGVISSARFNGNTATLVREALKGAERKGATVKEIFLYKYHMDFCTGCSKCVSDGKCPLSDDFSEIRELLYEADGIIWGSPTYGGAPNAIMKNLFDRLGMYEVLTSSLGGKYIGAISTAGSAMTAKKVARSLAAVTSSGIFERGYVSGVLGAGFIKDKSADKDINALKRARELGYKIAEDIEAHKNYPLQNILIRLANNAILKSSFIKYIVGEKENKTKAVYNNLAQRGYI